MDITYRSKKKNQVLEVNLKGFVSASQLGFEINFHN